MLQVELVSILSYDSNTLLQVEDTCAWLRRSIVVQNICDPNFNGMMFSVIVSKVCWSHFPLEIELLLGFGSSHMSMAFYA